MSWIPLQHSMDESALPAGMTTSGASPHYNIMHTIYQQASLLETAEDGVMQERIDTLALQKCLLYRVTEDPLSVQEYVLCQKDGVVGGLLRFVRDQLYPVIPERVFAAMRRALEYPGREMRSAIVFWSFVELMAIDESVMHFVKQTWPGSDRMWNEVVWPYYQNKRRDLLESPFDPVNAHVPVILFWRAVQFDVLPFNVRHMMLDGRLRPIYEPISRNAFRKHRKDDIEEREKARARQQQLKRQSSTYHNHAAN